MKKVKTRIVQRTGPDGRIEFVIQQKHHLLRWMWVDAWANSWMGAYCEDSFPTLCEAQRALPFFNGTPVKETVVG